MRIFTRVLVFGAVSGLVWALSMFAFDGFSSATETVDIAASGILTGILVSFALKPLLIRFGRLGAFLTALLALPVAAFVFGLLSTMFSMLHGILTGGIYDLHPLETGLWFAVVSVASLFAVYFVPAAVLTTFLLRTVVLSAKMHETAA